MTLFKKSVTVRAPTIETQNGDRYGAVEISIGEERAVLGQRDVIRLIAKLANAQMAASHITAAEFEARE